MCFAAQPVISKARAAAANARVLMSKAPCRGLNFILDRELLFSSSNKLMKTNADASVSFSIGFWHVEARDPLHRWRLKLRQWEYQQHLLLHSQ